MSLIWEMYQQGRIAKAESTAHHSAEKAVDAAAMVQQFQDKIDKLVLINMAIWELLKESSDVTEDDLMKKMTEIDLSDGKLDGKFRHTAITCTQCGRTMSNKHRRCLYCGHEPESQGAFDSVTG